MKEELSKYLTLNGRSISKRFSENAFARAEKQHLIEFVKDKTNTLHPEQTFAIRCWAVLRDCVEQHYCRTCNAPIVSKTENGWDKYCGRLCADTDPALSEMLLERRKKVDENAANVKRRKTMVDKFGVEFASQRESHKEALRAKNHIARMETSPELEDDKWLYQEHIVKSRNVLDISRSLNVHYTTVIYWLDRMGIEYTPKAAGYHISGGEREMFDFVKSICPDTVASDTETIGSEIDIFVKSKMIGFEYNGMYWHSDASPNIDAPTRHAYKQKMSAERGVRLVQIFECDWLNQRSKIERMIECILGAPSRNKGARSTSTHVVEWRDVEDFVNTHHIQGISSNSKYICLKYGDRIVAALGYRKTLSEKLHGENSYEITRFCSDRVSGSFGKLYKFLVEITNCSSVYSFADLLLCDEKSNLYTKNGFVESYRLKPDYKYVVANQLVHKFSLRKDVLKKKLGIDETDMTESEMADALRYRKIWDAGKICYHKKVNTVQ